MAEIIITSVEDIIQLKDIQSIFKLYKQWGIKPTKTNNKDDLVQVLLEFYWKYGSVPPKDRRTVSLHRLIKMWIHKGISPY